MKFKEKFAPTYKNLVSLERFVLAIVALNKEEKSACLIILTELFDNILSHSRPVLWTRISVEIQKTKNIKIKLGFISKKFREEIKRFPSKKFISSVKFDKNLNRYYGFGLTMCNNLSNSIVYNTGLLKSSITVII